MFRSSPQTAVRLRELPGASDLTGLFARLRERPHPWLLDSALAKAPLGRFSFAGADPYLVLRAFGSRVELEVLRGVRSDLPVGREIVEHDPLDVARSLMPAAPAEPTSIPFVGGAVGSWGYELAEQTEPVLLHGLDDLHFPDLCLLFVDRLVALEHETERIFAVGLGFGVGRAEAERQAGAAADDLASWFEKPTCTSAHPPRARPRVAAANIRASASEVCNGSQRSEYSEVEGDFDESSYAKAVSHILGEIEAGNVYQADMTHRMELPLPDGADSWSLYRELREVNPAPFGAYFEFAEGAILSSSPERFLRLDGTRGVESRPIKGTRPRGANLEEDRDLARALETSAKDRAENLMIVDLVRNDLGRVCEVGSISVPELMALESYASVFQLVSTVTGRLRSDCDATDLIRAAFPPGSMTGAPKIAAMELLDQLEPVRRGVYSGAIGYLDARGGLDLSVVIRTLIVARERVVLHAGGGVVADSNPVDEYRETLDKARALLAAVARAAGRHPGAEAHVR